MRLSYKYHTWDVPLQLLRLLKRRMRWVRAAGCVVHDDAGNMLLILRNGRWDLPKGKVELGETLLQAALRESEEETGIKVQPSTDRQAPVKTYHIFNLYGGWHLKQTSWFDGHAEGIKPEGKPQNEEGITAIEWVDSGTWHRRLEGSYGTLKTLSKAWIPSRK